MFDKLKLTQTTSVSCQFCDYLGYAGLVVSVIGGAILGGVGGCTIERNLQDRRDDLETSVEIPASVNPKAEEYRSSSALDRIIFGSLFGMTGGYILLGMPCQIIASKLSESPNR